MPPSFSRPLPRSAWIIVVPEYYNMKYIAHCEEMYDVNFAFNALSGDV